MMERPTKPRKSDYASLHDFMLASAAWAEQWNVWPWGGPKDEDDECYFEPGDGCLHLHDHQLHEEP